MADKDRYVTGQGMFGGVKGSYGRYSVSRNVSNLSPAQFNTMSDIEEQQMRRYKRRKEPNYSGAGFWFWNYPNMIGAIGSGSMLPVMEPKDQESKDADYTANPGSGLGEGGTAASASGAAGGSPA